MSFLSKNLKTFSILDIGTHKISCLIAKPFESVSNSEDTLPMIQVLGVGYQSSKGIVFGSIDDIDAMEEAVLACVQVAEKDAKETIRNVYVSIPSSLTSSYFLESTIELFDNFVEDKHLQQLLHVENINLSDHQILHVFPIEYCLDGMIGIKDPKGLHGKILSVKLHVIIVGNIHLRNIKIAMSRCQLEVDGYVSSLYASALATLFEEEKDIGVTLLDIGASHTGICCFSRGNVICHSFIPYGGLSITNDIIRGLSTPRSQAERLKTLYGNLNEQEQSQLIYVTPIDNSKQNHPTQISKHLLSHIIKSRIEEILDIVKLFLIENKMYYSNQIVLTGGTSQIIGITDISFKILNSVARTGVPKKIKGIGSELLQSTMFSSLIGTLIYAIQDRTDRQIHKVYFKKINFITKIKNIFKKL